MFSPQLSPPNLRAPCITLFLFLRMPPLRSLHWVNLLRPGSDLTGELVEQVRSFMEKDSTLPEYSCGRGPEEPPLGSGAGFDCAGA